MKSFRLTDDIGVIEHGSCGILFFVLHHRRSHQLLLIDMGSGMQHLRIVEEYQVDGRSEIWIICHVGMLHFSWLEVGNYT